MSYVTRPSTPIPGLCEKYGPNRMVTYGALGPAFLNAVFFGVQTSDNIISAVAGAAFGFITGGISGIVSFSGAMKAHEAIEHRLHGRGMGMTRKVRTVYKAQIAAFTLSATAALSVLNVTCYGVRQDLRSMDADIAAAQQKQASLVRSEPPTPMR